MSERLSNDEINFFVGRITELKMRLNGVQPDTPYADVRQMCRTAAQLLDALVKEVEDLKNDGA